MHSTLLITDVDFVPASERDQAKGLMGFVRCSANNQLRLCGITLRKTAQGAYSISFPSRRDRNGAHYFYMKPLSHAARMDIERQVIGALKRDGRIK